TDVLATAERQMIVIVQTPGRAVVAETHRSDSRSSASRIDSTPAESLVSLAHQAHARYSQDSPFDNCQWIIPMPMRTSSAMRKPRFSLRLAMVMIVLAAVPLARLAVRARAQKEAVLAITNAGGFVGYDWQFLPDGRIKPSPKPPGQSWIHKWLGPDYFQTVEQ